MISVNLYSNNSKELEKFLTSFYNSSISINNNLNWKHDFNNPVEATELIGVYIDNIDDFNIRMLLSLDKNIFINVTEDIANDLIKYIYERFPY